MPAISTCPRCRKHVSIPNGVDLAVLVRCPLCDAEYPLGDVIPPELIPIVAPTPDESAWAADIDSESAAAAEGKDNEENIITIPLEPGEEFVEATEADDRVAFEPASTDDAPVSFEEAEAEAEEAGEVPIEEENEATAVMVRAAMAPARVRRRAPKSALQTLIEVIAGGVAGCLVAYYGLAIYFGPEFKTKGLPKIPLPGIAWLTTAPEKTNGAGEKPVAEKSAKPKPANGKALPKTPDLPKESPKTPPKELPEPPSPPEQQATAAKPNELPKEPPKASPEPPSPPEQQAAAPKPNDLPPPKEAPPEIATPKTELFKPLRPKPGSADYLGPRMPPSVTSDQLGKALKETNGIISDDTTGDSVTSKAYEAFCRLGEAVSFVDGDASDARLADRIAAARTLLEKIAGRPELFEELGRLAGERIDAQAGQNAGILLAGTVKGAARQGRLSGAMVQLAGQSKNVSVLSDRELEAKADDRVLVLGVVVREPGANLVGYTGTKPAVVWAATVTKTP